MFENVIHQSATQLLSQDIKTGNLPGSILFAGPAGSGKLSAALETARILSCPNGGAWTCNCESCKRQKALISTNVLVLGATDRTLEIRAARASFLSLNAMNSGHLEGARYLYLRAVRKLLIRFTPILWEGDDKLSKFSPVVQSIQDNLETLNPGKIIPDGDKLEKILDDIQKQVEKLEDSFLYDSIPVSQVRNISRWAHLTSGSVKKVLIIENADAMADSARNALLKILEEPPADVVFILTTTKRGAMLPTILSRVRTYTFNTRTVEQQQEVLNRVFHYDPTFCRKPMPTSINEFLLSYLDIEPATVKEHASDYFNSIAAGHVPDVQAVMTSCGNFNPRVLFSIFMEGIIESQKGLASTPAGCECSVQILQVIREAVNSVSIFNQNPAAALEQLARSLLQINHTSGGVFQGAVNE